MLIVEPVNRYHFRLRFGAWVIGHIVRRHALEWAWFLQIPIEGGVRCGEADKEVVASAAAIEAASDIAMKAPRQVIGLALKQQRMSQQRTEIIVAELAAGRS